MRFAGRRVRSREKAKKRISGESLLYGWVNEGEGEIYFKSSEVEISVAATCEARSLRVLIIYNTAEGEKISEFNLFGKS